MAKTIRRIATLAAITGLMWGIAALPSNALAAPFLVNFQVNYTEAAATGALQQPDNLPLSFQYQLIVDLDNLSHVGPSNPFPSPSPFPAWQHQITSFDTNAVGASPVGSALKALIADTTPTYSQANQAAVTSSNASGIFILPGGPTGPILNETLRIIAENGTGNRGPVVVGGPGPIVIDPTDLSTTDTHYELRLTKSNSNDLNGEPEDRALDQNDLLSGFFFVGAEFRISEGIRRTTRELFSPLDVTREFFTYTGTAVITNLAAVNIPEPGMLALFGLSLVGLGFARRRKQTT